jgi:hypothetical protein
MGPRADLDAVVKTEVSGPAGNLTLVIQYAVYLLY